MLNHYLERFRDEIEVIEEEVKLTDVSRFLKRRNPTLFQNLEGHRAIGNLWATRARIASALKVRNEEIVDILGDAISNPHPTEVVSSSPLLENVSQKFDLFKFPFPLYYENDGGRYLTSGVVCAEFEGKKNMSFHRMMVLDRKRLVARIVERHLFAMYESSRRKNKELKIAICVGLCPSLLLAASVSTDYKTSELEIASALRKKVLQEPVKTLMLDGVEVPAFAEYVFMGRLKGRLVPEGPFVDITGTYDYIRSQPVVEIEKIYNKNNPLMHIMLPGGYEHYLLMGLPREPTIKRAVSNVVPHVKSVRLTEGGCCWLHGVVSIKKQREGDGKNAIMAAFSGHPSMKKVIVVDDDIDIFNDEEVEWAVATRFQAERDLLLISGARGSTLDPSSNGLTSKMGCDATRPVGKKGFDRVAK